MQPPHGGSTTGPKMSRKGAVNTNNNGGAHTQPHGVEILIPIGEDIKGVGEKYSFIETGNIGEDVDSIQDGGLCVSNVKPEPLDPQVLDSVVYRPQNPTVIARSDIINAEWIKSGSPGELVFFDQASDIVTESGVDDLTLTAMPMSMTASSAMPVSATQSANAVTLTAEGLPSCSSSDAMLIPVLVSDADAEPEGEAECAAAALSLSPSNNDSVIVKIADLADPLALSEMPGSSSRWTIKTKMGPKLLPSSSVIDGLVDPALVLTQDDRSQLSSQDRACLEEIERGSQLTAEEEELMEQVISPQELHSLPDQSLDLGLQTKSMTVLIDDENAAATSNIISPDKHAELSVSEIQKLISSSSNSAINANILGTTSHVQSDLIPRPVSSELSVQPASVSPSGAAGQGSAGGVATVQITTDNVNNTTQILVNTGSGMQLYQVNTADLEQAADAFQPLLSQHINASTPKVGQKSPLLSEGGNVLVPISKIPSSSVSRPADSSRSITTEAGKTSIVTNVVGSHSVAMLSKQDTGEKSWMCSVEDCDQRFTKPSQLKVHLMNHTGERPFKCLAEGCDWAFTTGHKLRRHEEAHRGSKNYMCEVPGCGKKFTTVYNLRTHKKLHTRQNTFQCPKPDCGETFFMQKHLDKHLKVHGNALKTYKCPYEGCERKFFSRLCMGSHARVHQRTLDLTCHFEGCGRVFDKLCRLKAHLRSHTGERPFPCPVAGCNWAFVTSSKLRRHLQKHTGERQFACPHEGCDKRFMRSEHLKGHMIIHTGTKPFACTIEGCEARFTARSTLYMHIKKHRMNAHQKVTYFCPLEGCNLKYYNKAALRSHIEKHYQKQLPSAGGGDMNLVPVVDLHDGIDTLVQQQIDTAGVVTAGAENAQVSGLLTLDGATINPADLLAAGDQPIIMGPTNLISTLNQGLTTIPVTIDLGNGQVGQVTLQGVLGPVQGLVAMTATPSLGAEVPVTSNAELLNKEAANGPRVIVAPDIDHGCTSGDNTGSSARTDYHSNHLLSHRAKMRQQRIKGNANADKFEDSSESAKASSGSGKVAALPEAEPTDPAAIFSLSDMMTSQAITFRDPETGAIYVQTQLLQDDPPNPEAFDETGMDTSDQSGLELEAELNSILQDSHGSDVADTSGGATNVEFSGSTINLQDLE